MLGTIDCHTALRNTSTRSSVLTSVFALALPLPDCASILRACASPHSSRACTTTAATSAPRTAHLGAMQKSATVRAAQDEAEQRRQKERAKAKDRKRGRRSSGAATAAAAAAAPAED